VLVRNSERHVVERDAGSTGSSAGEQQLDEIEIHLAFTSSSSSRGNKI